MPQEEIAIAKYDNKIRKGVLFDPIVYELFTSMVKYPFQRWVNLMMSQCILENDPSKIFVLLERGMVDVPFPENLYACILGEENYKEPPSDWQTVLHEAFKLTLYPDERSVIMFKYRDRLTLESIGEKMGITKESVRVNEKQAIEKLRKNSAMLFEVEKVLEI